MRHFFLVLCAVLLVACAEPVTPGFQPEAGLYLIDGSIVDQPGFSEVRVSLSSLRNDRYQLSPVSGAEVSSVDGAGNEVRWSQVENTAAYQPPAVFAGEAGQTYFLRVLVPDGQLFESAPEVMANPVPIVDSRITFSQDAYFSTGRDRFIPAFTLFIDFDDPAGERNFYLINYRKWEETFVCASCPERQRYRDGECEEWRRNFGRWDYMCDSNCWTIRESNGFELYQDELSDGNRTSNLKAGSLDFVSGRAGLLFEARLQSISGAAFQYTQVLKEAADGGGGLNAPNPAALVGNFQSVSTPDDIVLGFFSTASVTTHRAFIDRNTVDGTPLPSEFTIMFEPSPMLCIPEDVCPPLVDCDTADRTSEEPEGWGG